MTPVKVVVAAATVLALASAWHSGGHVWSRIQSDRQAYSALTPLERMHAPAATIGIDGAIFDWYAEFLVKGDRFYVQVDPEHDPRDVRILAGYYLLPAVEVADPSQATVIVTYFADPGTLGLRYLTQQRSGVQPIFVSRVSAP